VKRGAAATFLFVSLMILFLTVLRPPSAHADIGIDIDSSWASAVPVIDGHISAGEWADATVRNFTLDMRSRTDGSYNRTLQGTLYVKNNLTYVLFAVQIFNDTYMAQDVSSRYKGLAILFNDNDNGTLAVGDNGEGVTTWVGSPFYSHNDLYYAGGNFWDSDFDAGQTNDGALKWSHTNPVQNAIGNWTFEMAIPLVGSDGPAYDFNITSLPQTIGYKLWFEEPSKGLDGVYPDDHTTLQSIQQIYDAATFGDLTLYPLYNLTMLTSTGGTTTPSAPGTYQYPHNTVVNATATANAWYTFDHWELDSVNVGTANPYSVTMDQNHTLKAVFVKQLSVSISPAYTTFNVGGSVTFNSAVTGGTPAYSYQWYLGSSPVSGAMSSSWTFTPSAVGTYYVYLNVTDFRGRVAVSNTAKVVVTEPPHPVGGYSVSFAKTPASPPLAYYATAIAAFGMVISIVRRKRTGNCRSFFRQ